MYNVDSNKTDSSYKKKMGNKKKIARFEKKSHKGE
jgi:hypothetical protein